MATVSQWEDSLTYLSEDEIERIKQALSVLSQWDIFEREYKEMARLRAIVNAESYDRFMGLARSLLRKGG